MSNVLLLREPSPIPGDRYETAFNSAGYHTVSVPVLETVFANLPDLKYIINHGPTAERFDGVVITSGRACEAWKSAVHDLVKSPPEPSGGQFHLDTFASRCYLTVVTQTAGPRSHSIW